MTWYLSYQGTKKSFSEWNIFHATRRILNQGTDTFSFQSERNTLPFNCDEIVEIFKDNTRWFYGRITQIPCEYTSDQTYKTYLVSGPNWYLEHLVYQQPWQYFKDGDQTQTIPINRSLCVLGQDENGNTIDAQQCLTNIIQYAIQHGAPITCGNIQGFNFLFPCETIKDCSCAEVIKKLFRWTPDAVIWFDYATAKPTLHISRGEFLKSNTLSIHELSKFTLNPRKDLKVSSVVIKYEHTHSNENTSWKTTTIDAYPQNATGEELNALVLTIELEGTQTHLQEQWVQVQPIKTDSIDWWKQHFPTLASIPNDKINLSNIKRNTKYPNELIEGAIAPWMRCRAAYETITADISYLSKTSSIVNSTISLKICATDAYSKTYRNLIFLKTGVKPPTNLAKILYDATTCLQYEGTLKTDQHDLANSHMGQRLNFSNGETEWEHINVPVQEEYMVIDTGTTSLKFGAPKQLGPNDLIQLLQSNRARNITDDLNQRFASKSSGQTTTYFPHITPIINSNSDHGNYASLIICNADKKIKLDTTELPPNTEITFKPFDIVENGQLKKIWILSS